MSETLLRRPLTHGSPIAYWQVSPTVEMRYDVPDQPMSGEMDPFFFVTRVKNFIPHEYPCRTAFAAERRGQRPVETPRGAYTRNWLPFGSPRLDLSGFWFRPTVIATWARTMLVAASAGKAKLSLATCGGAILFVNGQEVGWMAPYGRNLETRAEFAIELKAGANEIELFFDDLAERDARYYVQLDYLEGPDVEQAIAAGERSDVAEAVEGLLSSMRFEEPAYRTGEVALVSDVALPVDAAIHVSIEGDFMSVEREARDLSLEAGETRLSLGRAEELPADFRHFNVVITAAGFTAARIFGVEISAAERQGKAPAAQADRIAETLRAVAENGEADTVTALARLAIGMDGAEAMIEGMLPSIEDCHDCADFILVPLIWSRARYADRLPKALVERIDAAMLSYRYWMDEPGNDVQWYFSENHALLFHTACYLAGSLLPDATFARSGRVGAEQAKVGAERVRAWLDHFEAWEMAEFNSAPYFPIDLKGLTALMGLAPDADIRQRAEAAILRLVEMVANSAHHGVLTGAQGRSYEHTLRASRTLELSGLSRLLWGLGNFGRRFHALPQMALLIRDHGLVVPADFTARASLRSGEAQEWTFAQGANRFAALYHYKTAGFALGTASAYRWGDWGYQETVFQARLGREPDASVWINHPGEVIHSGYGRPSYWGGCGTVPRVQQYRGLAVLSFAVHEGQPDFTHAWFPMRAFEEARVEGELALARSGEGSILIRGSAPFERVTTGPTAGNEIRLAGTRALWIVRLSETGEALDTLKARFGGLAVVEGEGGRFVVEDPDYGTVTFHADGRVEAEGRMIDPKCFTIEGRRQMLRPARTSAAA